MINRDRLRALRDEIATRSSTSRRFLVAIAGPPGAGKSTIASELALSFPSRVAKVVEMDGFHYDNAVLDELGLRARKGSAETFDFQGLATLLQRLRNCEPATAIPLFDRTADLSRSGAAIIRAETQVILIEGNYLLLDQPPWNQLAPYFDLNIFLDVSRDVLRQRLLRRWLDLGRSHEYANHWVSTNDMPNVDRVLANRRPADVIL